MKRVDYMQVAEEAMDQIRVGAFLTVKAGLALNTMERALYLMKSATILSAATNPPMHANASESAAPTCTMTPHDAPIAASTSTAPATPGKAAPCGGSCWVYWASSRWLLPLRSPPFKMIVRQARKTEFLCRASRPLAGGS